MQRSLIVTSVRGRVAATPQAFTVARQHGDLYATI